MFYEELLTRHQLKVEQLSKPTQALINKFNNTTKYLGDIEAKLTAATTDKSKNKLTTEIQSVKDYLAELEAQITKKINMYAKNKDVYAANGVRLAQGRAKKSGSGAPNEPPTPIEEPAPPSSDEPPANVDEPPVEPKEKKKSGAGWLLFGIAAVAAAAIGINIYKNRD